ncbi:MAG: HAD family hydrolase [bacterium]
MPINKPIRAVIFDLFHTLVSLEVSKAPGPGTAELLEIAPEEWNRQWLADPSDYVLGLAPIDVPFRRIANQLNPKVTEEQIQKALKVRQARFRHTLINVEPETIEGIKHLRRMGFKTGLISNCGWDEISAWNESPLAALFETVLFSCAVKLKKPDPEIYYLAARNLDVLPANCLFVGNGGSEELTGARHAGMTPVLLTRHLETIKPERIIEVIPEARIVIRTIGDLALILPQKPI